MTTPHISDINSKDFTVATIGSTRWVVKGLGKLFYQDGFPIGMGIRFLQEHGYKVSILHLADELLQNGWSTKTILSKLREELVDSNVDFDLEQTRVFLEASYEESREMYFSLLFGEADKKEALKESIISLTQ